MPGNGGGSAALSQSPTWRAALLGGAAVGALLLTAGRPAIADTACSVAGTVQTCTGDQSDGVAVSNPAVDTLNVNNLTRSIRPASGVDGIHFEGDGPIGIVSDTGSRSISVVNANGITARSYDGGDVSVEHSGRIRARGGIGISAVSAGAISTDSSGTIRSGSDGIRVINEGLDPTDTITIEHVGKIRSQDGHGIYADGQSDISSTSEGRIHSELNAIHLNVGGDGAVVLKHTGALVSDSGAGVSVVTLADASVTVIGDIDAGTIGIHAHNTDNGAVLNVNHTGKITARGGAGIDVNSSSAAIVVDNDGAIHASGNGISATNTSAETTSVSQKGAITSGGHGIYAASASGEITVTASGNIDAGNDGIFAESTGFEDVIVEHSGDISSSGSNGIYGYSASGGVSVKQTGAIDASKAGVFAQSSGHGVVTVEVTGDITQSATGIYATSVSNSVTVTSKGDFTSDGDGIYAENSGSQKVTVDHKGSINAGGNGIYAYTPSGEVSVKLSGGNIDAGGIGVLAQNDGAQAVTVDIAGNITNSGAHGIHATSIDGAVTVTNHGTIDSSGNGVFAKNSNAAAVTVTRTGNIKATGGSGIEASAATGEVAISSASGDIDASGDGIVAYNTGSSTVKVDFNGNIEAGGRGVDISSSLGVVTLNQFGTIDSGSDGIRASTLGSNKLTINRTGDIKAGGDGISATSPLGEISVTSLDGNITAGQSGVVASNTSGNKVAVTVTGNITANGGSGIDAASSTGIVAVVQHGDVKASGDGVRALNLGSNTVTVNRSGNITAGGVGISATTPMGAVSVTSLQGDISAGDVGILATNESDNSVTVDFLGNITGSSKGIVATSSTGVVTVTTEGDLTSKGDTLTATNLGDNTITVDHVGAVTSSAGNGILATSSTGIVDVDVTGNISAALTGITAKNESYNGVTVDLAGNISGGTRAIDAFSANGIVTVTTKGDLGATGDVITAGNTGDSKVTVDHGGDVISKNGNGIVATSTTGVVDVTVRGGQVTAPKDAIQVRTTVAANVTVEEDSTVTGGAGFAAVRFQDGPENTLTNYGTIANAGEMSDHAVQATLSQTAIDNWGTISGSVDLGGWVNSFANNAGALFNAGTVVNIGQDNTLWNDGTVSPGGDGPVQVTALTGNLVNTQDGTLLYDVDMAGEASDRIDVSGSADLDGNLALRFTSLGAAQTTFTLMTAAEGITTRNLALVLNPMILGSIAYTLGDTQVELTIDGFDFAPAGTTGNANAIGRYLSASIGGGSSGLYPLGIALLNLQSLAEVNDALNQLSPNVYTAQQVSALYDMQGFADSLMSCRTAGGVNKFGAEGQCVWAKAGYRNLDHDGSGTATGFSNDSWEMAGGAQYAPSADWRVGVAVGAATSDLDADNGATSDGKVVKAGVVVKYVPGPLLVAASLSGSYGWYDTVRPVSIGDFSDTLEGSPKVGTLNAGLRAAYTLQRGEFYAKPQVDLNASYMRTGRFTETGGAASVFIDANSHTVFSITPSLELGGETVTAGGALLRPYVRAGVALYSDTSVNVRGGFAADTAGTSLFENTTSSDEVLFKLSAGLDVLQAEGAALRLFYDGSFGDTTTENAVGMKFSLKY